MGLLGGQSGGDEKALTVSRLVRRMKNVLEIEVGEVWVEGEVSGLRRQSSGHVYFTLKDAGGAISCAMFARSAKSKTGGGDLLDDGKKVRVFGEVTLYEARGQAQLIVKKVKVAGEGDLQAKFEALKQKLNAEGLFDADQKKALPKFPRVIGMVTSPTGAALQDMLNILSRRAPWVKVLLFPARVQGDGGEGDISRAIRLAGNYCEPGVGVCDVLIVGRGGGSMEDLWNFNEELVARAIADCPIPVVSAVGHEIDFTIADFVADERAPTPSAAAELVVPDREELLARLEQKKRKLNYVVDQAVDFVEQRLDMASSLWQRKSADQLLREKELSIDDLSRRLKVAVNEGMGEGQARLARLRSSLAASSPLSRLREQELVMRAQGLRLKQRASMAFARIEADLSSKEQVFQVFSPEKTFKRGFSMTLDESGEIAGGDEQLIQEGKMLTTYTAGALIRSQIEESETREG